MTARRRRGWPGRIARWLGVVLLVAWLASVAAVVLLRFVPPPITAMMLWQGGPLRDLDYVWVDVRDIAPAAPRPSQAYGTLRYHLIKDQIHSFGARL